MKLLVKNIQECVECTLKMDEHIPFTVEFTENQLEPPLYWIGGDKESSLIEIALNRRTGDICNIVLVSISSEKVFITDELLMSRMSVLPKIDGVPRFDINNWDLHDKADFSNNFYNEPGSDFQLFIGPDYLSLVFEYADKPAHLIITNNIQFCISKNNHLSVINLLNINNKQRDSVILSSQANL